MTGNGDSLRRVQAGDRAQIPADAYNAFLDVVRDRRAAAFDGGAGAVRIPPHPPATVLARNDTGGDLDRFAVVALGAPAVAHADDETEFFRRPNLAADAPEGGEAVFGVLLEPAADGAFAPAQVSGVCPVRVNVTDEAHTHASPVAGDTEMLGSGAAGVPVLWKESGTGTKWAYVLLGTTAAAAGAITVKEVDGTPNYTGITTLRLDRETGIIANAVADGVNAWVMGVEASPTQWGMMTPNPQSFAGAKIFGQSISCSQDFVRIMTPNPNTCVFGADLNGGYVEYTDIDSYVTRLDILGGASGDFEFYTSRTSARGLSLIWSGGSAIGQTGTSGGGDTVTSGLVTALGSGPSTIDGGTW